jgi:hypothetical protein
LPRNDVYLADVGGGTLSDWDEAEVERAPICPDCGVTALPAEASNVIDSPFVCDNADCEAFGELVDEL